jgi:hypothetical protein
LDFVNRQSIPYQQRHPNGEWTDVAKVTVGRRPPRISKHSSSCVAMKVKNVNGISDTTCKCNDWLHHWTQFSGRPLPKCCAEALCRNRPRVGAHVQKVGATDDAWYIVPLCRKHSRPTGETLQIMRGIKLVSADVSQTCGR